MFESLSDRLQGVFRSLRGEVRLTEATVEAALREIRMALLEADVNFKVVKAFIDRVRDRAVDQEVLKSLTPAQQVVRIVRDEMLAHIREIVNATALPVNADFHAGFADGPEDVAANVRLCVETGVAGLSIEDSTGRSDCPLYEKKLAIERIRAARSAIDASKSGVVLTGRCEAWLVGDPDPRLRLLDAAGRRPYIGRR